MHLTFIVPFMFLLYFFLFKIFRFVYHLCIIKFVIISIRYFAARQTEAGKDWERAFRCFVYRFLISHHLIVILSPLFTLVTSIIMIVISPRHDGWAVAMSGNAHCHLHSATEGDRTLRIHKGVYLIGQ